MTRYIVYQITNLINGKIYIGAHMSSSNEDDGYMGSGKRIRRAIRYYGRKCFTKQVLAECATREEMYAHERSLVTPTFVARRDTYNLVPGGEGFAGATSVWTPERRRQQAERARQLRPENKGRKLNLSQEERKARSNRKANLGRISITQPELHLNKLVRPESLEMWKADGWVEGLYHKTKPTGRPATGTSRVALWRHTKKQMLEQKSSNMLQLKELSSCPSI